jgi:hypothetical protein
VPHETHDEFLEWALQRAAKLDLFALHVPDSRRVRGTPGAPDLFVVGPRGAVWAELKVGNDRPSRNQNRWGYRLKAAGQFHGVYWPEHKGLIDYEFSKLIGT